MHALVRVSGEGDAYTRTSQLARTDFQFPIVGIDDVPNHGKPNTMPRCRLIGSNAAPQNEVFLCSANARAVILNNNL